MEFTNINDYVCQRCGKQISEDNAKAYSDNNSGMILCSTCYDKFIAESNMLKNKFTGLKDFEMAAYYMIRGLENMGMDIDVANFGGTPKRVGRAYYEIFSGCENTEKQVNEILHTAFPCEGDPGMIITAPITAFSMCPHHLLPVEYTISVGYIPGEGKGVLGLSKLARLVEVLAKRPVLQEQLGKDIVESLATLGVDGAGCRIVGKHMCMRMRGVKKPEASTITSYMTGSFKEDSRTRSEFFDLVSEYSK